ncbi:MAG: YraN family protein [Muribaculaceae bacterium]|nr:YraN family protein [Muribaculaceae bacterium]
MARHNDIGKWGEQMAVEHLIKAGYAIIERNWHMPPYEIDIVASIRGRIAFCEVKTRSDKNINASEAITPKKISALVRAAHVYILAYDVKLEPQFDVITVNGVPDDFIVEHIPDAFLPPLRTY